MTATGCGSSIEVKGTLTLDAGGNDIHWLALRDPVDGDPCEGDMGYSDIGEGSAVVVRNGRGDKVGLGHLSEGAAKSGACVFRFTVSDVPDSGIMSVEVAHRGEVSFKPSEAKSLALTLG